MPLLQNQPFDLPVLYVNLGGATTYPVAEELRRLKAPFIFVSVYATTAALLQDIVVL